MSPAVLAVPSPSRVVYRCPRQGDTWPPGTFNLTLNALAAGPTGCSGEGSATAQVVVKPVVTVTVTPPVGVVPVSACSNASVDVTFTVETSGGDSTGEVIMINVPNNITSSNGTTCDAVTPTKKCEWCQTMKN
jgi:hypothetical protein